MEFVSRNVVNPYKAFEGLEADTTIHGLTNGSWSFGDGIAALARRAKNSHLIIATWTAGAAEIVRYDRLCNEKEIESCLFLVDFSFRTRQPKYCALLRERFGDDCIRVWNCHAKFAIIKGADLEILYLTSANLNKNPRIENFTITTDPEVVKQYRELVNNLFEEQKPGEGFLSNMGPKRDTNRIVKVASNEEEKPEVKKSLFER